MFGFLNSREVTDDAIRIVHSIEQILSDIETLSIDDFTTKFAGPDANIPDRDRFSFKVSHEPDFVFHYSEMLGEPSIAVTGGAKYAGFALYPKSTSYSEWHCNAKDGIAYKATAGAHKMVKVLRKKYGIESFGSIF